MSLRIGCDLGMSSVKLVGAAGEMQFLSQAALYGGEMGDFFGGRRKKPTLIESDFGKLWVGVQAHSYGSPIENLGFDRLAESNEARAVLYGAWAAYQRKYGEFDDMLKLVVGLPFQMLIGESASVARFRRQVNGWLAGTHEFAADGRSYRVTVAEVHLFPQALGAPIDYALAMNGEAIAERAVVLQKECATISIGSNTVELLVMKRDKDTKRFNGGKPIGVRSLWRRVDPQGYYSFGEFDELLRTNDLPESMDITPHLSSWMSEIRGFANQMWGESYHRFYRVFVVGGGAILLKRQLRGAFDGKAIVVADPVMAIARGLYKAGFGLGI